MTEADFMDDFQDSFGNRLAKKNNISSDQDKELTASLTLGDGEMEMIERDLSRLTDKEKLKILQASCPELLFFLEDFETKYEEWQQLSQYQDAFKDGETEQDKLVSFYYGKIKV